MEIFGFKSFKHKTVLEFVPHEIVGIVGPNGCGKSNVLDALLWVMGENSPKQLRGESLSDIIFGGTLREPQGNLAEVALTLDKGEGMFPENYKKFSEVTIRRRIFRDGRNECFFNQTKCLLKDIREFFMNTGVGCKGFSIIEQEAIEKLIAAKPLQRRFIIEEVAGITKFKSRKSEAKRKLETAYENLKRLDDILKSQESQLNKLSDQAKKATKYKKLKRNIDVKNMEIARKDKEGLFCKYQGLNKEQKILRKKQGGFREQIYNVENQIAAENKKLEDIEREIKKMGLNLKALGQDLENVKQQETEFKLEESHFLQIMRSLKEIEAQKNSLQAQEKNIRTEISQLQDPFQKNLNCQKEEQKARTYLEEIKQRKSDISSDVNALQLQIQFIEKEKEKQELERVNIQNQIQKNINRKNKLKALLEKQRQMSLKFSEDAQSLLTNEKVLELKKVVLDKKIQRFNQEIFVLQHKIHTIKDFMSFFKNSNPGSVILKKRNPKAFQSLLENLKVDSDYKTVLHLALGHKLNALVSKDDVYIENAVEYLKNNSKGKSCFLSSLPGVSSALELKPEIKEKIKTYPAVIGFLSDKVKWNVHSKVFRPFLEQTVIVSHLKAAFELKKQFPAFHFITPEGDMITRDSFVYAGSKDQEINFLQPPDQIDKFIKELSSKKLELKVKTMEMASCVKQLTGIKKQILKFQSKNIKNFKTEIPLQKDIEQMTQELIKFSENRKRNDQKIKTLEKEKQNLLQHSEAYIQELQDLDQKISHKEIHLQNLQNKIEWDKRLIENRNRQQNLNQKIRLLFNLAHESKIFEKDSDKSPGIEKKESLFFEKGAEENMENQFSDKKKIMERTYQQKKNLSRRIKELEESKTEQNNLYKRQKTDIEGKEKSLLQLRFSVNNLQAELGKKDLEKNYVREKFLENHKFAIEDYTPEISGENVTLDQLKQLKEGYEKQLDSIKEINFLALEEYEKLSKENFSFNSQREDLVNSKKALLKLISHIDNICETRFTSILEEINKRFSRIFPIVFPGDEARAELVLHKEPESEDYGVDIMIHPPGKNPQSVTLLSRGEKALTSVCLIYSLFLVKPSPFCVIDEADAPLDDANIFRFLSILEEMAKKSQLIVITHNKHTMQICKKLYGVTLQGPGLSQVVSVDRGASSLSPL